MLKPTLALLLMAALLLPEAASAATPRYKLVDLGAPPVAAGSFPRSQATAINNRGQAVGMGNYRQSSAALLNDGEGGSFALLAALQEFAYSVPKGINDHGVIVGAGHALAGAKSHAFYLGERLTIVAPLAKDEFSSLTFVSESGLAVGLSGVKGRIRAIYTSPELGFTAQELPSPEGSAVCRAKSATGAFIYGDCESERREDFPVRWKLGEGATPLALLENSYSGRIHAANRQGIAVGNSLMDELVVANPIMVATLWAADGQPWALGTCPGDNYSEALGINADGVVVGFSSDQTKDTFRAALFYGGEVIDLLTRVDGPHDFRSLDRAFAINDHGVIAGYGTLTNGQIRGFLLVPSAPGR